MIDAKKTTFNSCEDLHIGFRPILSGKVTLQCKVLKSASLFFDFT